jgi:hypothetical protein
MGYKIGKWYLYKAQIDITFENNRVIHFFSRWRPRKGTPSDLPEEYKVLLNERTHLPYLKRKGGMKIK